MRGRNSGGDNRRVTDTLIPISSWGLRLRDRMAGERTASPENRDGPRIPYPSIYPTGQSLASRRGSKAGAATAAQGICPWARLASHRGFSSFLPQLQFPPLPQVPVLLPSNPRAVLFTAKLTVHYTWLAGVRTHLSRRVQFSGIQDV